MFPKCPVKDAYEETSIANELKRLEKQTSYLIEETETRLSELYTGAVAYRTALPTIDLITYSKVLRVFHDF